MALLVLDDSLLHFLQLNLCFINKIETTFIQDLWCHLTLCLQLIEPYCS